MKIKYVANAARWFDKTYGNTYHSVRITRIKDNKTLYCPFQYGYGDCYRQTALEAMSKEKWLPAKYRGREAYMYERENNYPIQWDVADGLKRDCVANGYDPNNEIDTKRLRQVRDALNKTKNKEILEKIANILNV